MSLGFHEDIKKLTEILKKNLFPAHLVERVVNQYLTLTCYEYNPPVSVSDATTNFYFKLPYIGPFSVVTLKKVCQFAKCYCNNIDIKVVFFIFQNRQHVQGVRDPIPHRLCTCVLYKFLCVSCNACSVGETFLHLSTCVREYLVSDRTSHIFRHLHNSPQCCIQMFR